MRATHVCRPTCTITIPRLLLHRVSPRLCPRESPPLIARSLLSVPPNPPLFILAFPLRFRSVSARRALARYFRPADRSRIESSPMAARSSSRLLALAGRAASARLAPAAPASALLAGNVARGFATAAPAEEDVVKAAFIKQQASFRSYLEGLKKVPIPMDAADDKATKAYAAAVKNIRESLGIPSFSEKLSNLLESAEEDSCMLLAPCPSRPLPSPPLPTPPQPSPGNPTSSQPGHPVLLREALQPARVSRGGLAGRAQLPGRISHNPQA
ncbi:unnamed protein product, partial [Closterium sp. NIES-53]